MILEPGAANVTDDLNDSALLYGCETGRWRIVSNNFPILEFAIAATEPDGSVSEYGFRAELSNYPAQAPLVRIWDFAAKGPLAVEKRPKGGGRVTKTFQHWGSDTVYRPWDRMTGPHNENAVKFPQLAWRADRRLTFILEDLHAILNANARASGVRTTA